MLHKTLGIVFKTTDYSESSVVVQVFTQKFGLQSYLLNGVKKPKSKISRNLLQPLHLLDMVVYHKVSGNIQRVAELRSAGVFLTIPYDIIKSSLIIFLNEVLYKAIRQQSADEALFDFVFHAIAWLDNQQGNLSNFHLLFLVKLTRYLGFYPQRASSGNAEYFDLKEGLFLRHKPAHALYLSPPHTQDFNLLMRYNFNEQPLLRIDSDGRRYLINKLLEYYALHVDGFGNVHSNEILEEILG